MTNFRKLERWELILLASHNQREGKMVFTEEDLTLLQKGEATFRTFNQAERVIDVHRKRMQLPPSREEIFQLFLDRASFQEYVNKHLAPVLNQTLAVDRLLVAKGIITDAEIVAEAKKMQEEMAAKQKEAEALQNLKDSGVKPEFANAESIKQSAEEVKEILGEGSANSETVPGEGETKTPEIAEGWEPGLENKEPEIEAKEEEGKTGEKVVSEG